VICNKPSHGDALVLLAVRSCSRVPRRPPRSRVFPRRAPSSRRARRARLSPSPWWPSGSRPPPIPSTSPVPCRARAAGWTRASGSMTSSAICPRGSAVRFGCARAWWRSDGDDLGPARELHVWRPIRGRHGLELIDGHGRVVDRVSFDVRGVPRAAHAEAARW